MSHLRTRFVPALALVAALGCGGSFFIAGGNGQLLVVVSVHPVFVDAVQFPNGQVLFTAQGTFNESGDSVDPLTNVVWTIDRPAFSLKPDLGHAFIDQTGLATCAPGFVGIVQVFATAPADPRLAMSAQNAIVGTAHMVCP